MTNALIALLIQLHACAPSPPFQGPDGMSLVIVSCPVIVAPPEEPKAPERPKVPV